MKGNESGERGARSNEVEGASLSKVDKEVADDSDRLTSRAINAFIVLGFGTFAVSKLLTIDHDYWHVSVFNWTTTLV